MAAPVLTTSLSGLNLVRRGKVRDVYSVDDQHLLIVATDRLSAFDCVLPTPIERKGEILTAISRFWFDRVAQIVSHHLITTGVDEMPDAVRAHADQLRGRCMFVRRTEVVPVECVVRGYLAGSGWKDYQRNGEVCGIPLPAGMVEAQKLAEPIFTPATKAESGHDLNISFDEMASTVSLDIAERLRDYTFALYTYARDYAAGRGIIIADTKFEFGLDQDGRILLIDEIFTPDSSRFWPADKYEAGGSPPSFDKQFVRDYLESLEWDKHPPAPALPDEIALATTERYLEAYRLLTGNDL
ncbi:MAG: phosphoribosylaminoimidazolesuccinocarboxamide synthase [Pyrinomonadaceae bacterium]